MARLENTVLLEWEDPDSWQVVQVQEADCVYSVYYRGKPIGMRTFNQSGTTGLLTYKYGRSSFQGNIGHARRLAKRLNAMFETDEFVVAELTVKRVFTDNEFYED